MYFTIEIRRLAFYIFCVIKRGIEVVGINKNILMADVKCTVSDVGSPIGVYLIIYFKYVSRGDCFNLQRPRYPTDSNNHMDLQITKNSVDHHRPPRWYQNVLCELKLWPKNPSRHAWSMWNQTLRSLLLCAKDGWDAYIVK